MDYSVLIGYSITCLVFGLAFFLLFINLYHYDNLKTVYVRDDIVSKRISDSSLKLEQTKKNISTNFGSYRGGANKVALLNLYSKIYSCINKFDDENFQKLLNKDTVDVVDVYDLLVLYKNNILNDCIIVQIYDMNSLLELPLINDRIEFIKLNANALVNDLDYIKKNLENNSSYFMSSSIMKSTVFDYTRDSYIEFVNSYQESVNLVYQLSVLYKESIEGEL